MATVESKNNKNTNNNNTNNKSNNNNGSDEEDNPRYSLSFESTGIFAPVHIFSTFPIHQIHSITSLNLNSNCFTYIPDEISMLCNLEVLNVAHNHIRY